MSVTNPGDISNQQVQMWSGLLTKELREKQLLAAAVNKDYNGEINKQGDTVRVSQVNAPEGDLLTIGVDSDSFGTEMLSTSYVDVKADKRAVAAYEFEDAFDFQTQFDKDNSEIRQALVYAIDKQINTYLYSLVAPSTSNPDHSLASVTDMNSGELSGIRLLAATAKWDETKPWYGFLDPTYYSDVLDDTTLNSTDSGASDNPVIGGKVTLPRYGFQLVEDNSRPTDYGLFFHPDFMHLVMQPSVRIKISDAHSSKKFTSILSADIVFGAKLGIDGAKKHILVR